ncbi:ABC transporter permease [Bartonella tamiae]|uniref:ABC transmembrane type-1 domain-containing protein n=1 Tax=Bartonella tamiae Th239 TaxID=1094558 RepID=J0R0X8_9HYPH|nr:ABC transporter permease subunit [Bartonella tamiae]EJF89194.1 hypothetical protein ME5_01745 [Bartonella tamiae Th239]
MRTSKIILIGFTLPAIIAFILFFLIPVTTVLWSAFEGGSRAFSQLWADRIFWNGLYGTIILAFSASLMSVCLGVCIAMVLSRLKPYQRSMALMAISLPLTFSGLIVAYGFILLLGRSGFIVMMLEKIGFDPAITGGFIYSPYGLALAYSYYLTPRVILIMLPSFINFDQNQFLAARSLGARFSRAFLDIVFPQIMPSVVASFCLTASVATGAYGTALALAGTQVNILPLLLYSKISETGTDMPGAGAVSLVLVAICTLIIAFGEMVRAYIVRRKT